MKSPQLQVEIDQVITRIAAYEGDEDEFTKIMAAALIVAALAGKRDEVRRLLADRCEVAMSTVDRWASGTARPHPRMREYVLDVVMKIFASASL